MRVVVGTPAVLEQALTHGFVQICRLSLLVFDEARRCVKSGPMNGIMANFYYPAKSEGESVPHILGLTASPIMRGEFGDLEKIESNLDCTAITPTENCLELERFVSFLELSCITYNSCTVYDLDISQLCRAINHSVDSYDFSTDPYIMQLREHGDEESQRALAKQAADPKTFCYRQLKALRQRSNALLEQLGPIAAEWYIAKCMKRYLDSMQSDLLVLADINEQEKNILALYSSHFLGLV